MNTVAPSLQHLAQLAHQMSQGQTTQDTSAPLPLLSPRLLELLALSPEQLAEVLRKGVPAELANWNL